METHVLVYMLAACCTCCTGCAGGVPFAWIQLGPRACLLNVRLPPMVLEEKPGRMSMQRAGAVIAEPTTKQTEGGREFERSEGSTVG